MNRFQFLWRPTALICILLCGGCVSHRVCSVEEEINTIGASDIPRELSKASLPDYRVEPPDILLIESVNNIRLPSYLLRAGDAITIRLANPEPLEPIGDKEINPIEADFRVQSEAQAKIVNGEYRIQPDGTVNLGPIYGKAAVEGLILEQAKEAVVKHLQGYTVDDKGNKVGIRDPHVSVTMEDLAGKQIISGEHLVRPDGTVSLGIYGQVYVAGMTLDAVKCAIEQNLAQFIHQPEINVDVLAYNSKVCYVITDGAGFGEQVQRLPITGNETVLDTIAAIDGLSEISSKRIWVARPAPAGTEYAQVMDVDWRAITAEGLTATNYQVLPGDRIYIQADPLVKLDNLISKIANPVERIFGLTLLNYSVLKTINQGVSNGFGGSNGNNGGGGGFF